MKLKQSKYKKEAFSTHYEIPFDQISSFELQPAYSNEFQRRLLLLYSMTQKLTESNNKKEIFKTAMEWTCEILQVNRSSLGIVNHEQKEITLLVLHGVESHPKRTFTFGLNECAIGHSYKVDAIIYRNKIENSTCPLLNHLYQAGIRSTMVVPIVCGDVRFGTLNTGSIYENGYGPDDLHLLAQISAILATHLQNFELRDQKEKQNKLLKEANKELKHLATIDTLTKLYNRRHINSIITYEIDQQLRRETPFSLIMFDIDNFKAINDKNGHLVGDEVLCELSNLCSQMIRQNDILARWGGEEFLIACINTNKNDALYLAEKIRAKFEAYSTSSLMYVTASFGITQLNSDEKFDTLMTRLDHALYQSKHAGRNCSTVI